MTQLRQDHEKFSERDTVVLVVGPEDADKFRSYFTENDLPFTGLPDPNHRVLKQYGQEIKIFKLGRMPAQVLVDKESVARFVHYGNSMSDIPTTEEMTTLIDKLQAAETSPVTNA